MRVAIRRIGRSKGVIIPRSLLAQSRLETEVDISVEGGALVLRAPAKPARAGWADASRALAAAGDDVMVLPELLNAGDTELEW